MIEVKDKLSISLRGELEVILISKGGASVLYRGVNHICDNAVLLLLGLLGRDFDNKMISKVHIATGGDLDPVTGLDTGARVAPRDEETKVRQLLFACPVANFETDSTKVTFTAVAKTNEANSDTINEFALVSEDGTILSHFVTQADFTGRAAKYVKDDLLYLVVRWKIYPELRRS